jgi:hypothetical protein
MAGFDAGKAVSPLDYTLKPYIDVAGRLKEPSDRQIADFLDGIKSLFKQAQDAGLEGLEEADAQKDPNALIDALDQLSGDAVVEMFETMAAMYGELCSGVPSKDQLLQLPLRVRGAFYQWVQNEVINPEAAPAAGMRPVSTLPRAAGG